MPNKQHGHYVEPESLEKLASTVRKEDKEITLEIMNIKPNDKIIDIGCGPAVDTINFAKKTGNKGEVVGIDYDEEMIEIANLRTKENGLEKILTHIRYDIIEPKKIPYPDNYFDITHTDRVLFHNKNPEYILQEMIRVTKPGGKIIAKGEDISSWSWSPFSLEQDHFIKRKMSSVMHYWNFPKNSLFLFKKYKLIDINIKVIPVVNKDFYGDKAALIHFKRFGISKKKAIEFIKMANEYNDQGAYYDIMNVIITYGIKP